MGAAESKLAFRKNVFRLYEQKSIPDSEEEFWASFFTLPESPEDVFNLFSQKDIRMIIQNSVPNLSILIKRACATLLGATKNTTSQQQPFQPLNLTHIINSIRILTRFLPFIFELEDPAIEDSLFWTPSPDLNGQPLGKLLCQSTVDLLFLRGRISDESVQLLDPNIYFQSHPCSRFTLPALPSSETPSKIQYIIWHQGVGSTSAPPITKEECTRRTETLRLLITLLSKTIYFTPGSSKVHQDPWSEELTRNADKRVVLGLLCSLINTLSAYDPIGWAAVPYQHLIFGDVTEPLVSGCAQTLSALLDVRSAEPNLVSNAKVTASTPSDGNENEVTIGSTSSQPNTPTDFVPSNGFRYYFAKLHRSEDFEFILDGFTRLLHNRLDASKAYLPGSTKSVSLTTELLGTLWILLTTNSKFLAFSSQSTKARKLLEALIFISMEARHDPAKSGQLRICCFILHLLSEERSFGLQMNEPFELSSVGTLSKNLPVFSNGCWGDFLFLSIYTIMSTKSPARTAILALQEPYLVILSNVSPLIKSLTATTANKILALLDIFSSPGFLLSKENNHRLLFYVLDMVNNIIQYQYAGHSQLVYSLIRDDTRISKLDKLDFDTALLDFERIKELRKQRRPSTSTPKETVTPIPAPQPLSEKSKGKLPLQQSFTDASQSRNGSSEDLQQTSAHSAKDSARFDGFVPTKEWFDKWKPHLPLTVILALISYLKPKVEKLCQDQELNDDRVALQMLSKETIVGILPQPHPILMRKFTYNSHVHVWFTSFLWGAFYVKGTSSSDAVDAETAKLCPSIWIGTKVKLFQVKLNS